MSASSESELLEIFKVSSAPSTVFYLRDFITEIEHSHLWNKIYSAPKPKWRVVDGRRVQIWGGYPTPKGMIPEALPDWLADFSTRIGKLRLFDQAKFNAPNHVLINEYPAGQGIMPHEDGPLYFPTIVTISLNSHTVLDFYKHPRFREDNNNSEAAAPPHMGGSMVAHRTPEEKEAEEASRDKAEDRGEETGPQLTPEFSLIVQRGSLLVLKDSMYTDFMHGIAPRVSDTVQESMVNHEVCGVKPGETYERRTRMSLTFRVVEKVSKLKLFS